MRTARWICAGTLSVLLVGSGMTALAQGNGKGKGKGHNKHNDDRGEYYGDHEREEARGWYDGHESHLPPGLAKRDRLPPGLEKQLVRNGRLPPGLQKRIEPCPPELVRVLPPPPPDCAHVLIAGHIVLLNRRTDVVIDIIHFD